MTTTPAVSNRLIDKRTINLAAANAALTAAVAAAQAVGMKASIAVLDDAAHLIAFARMDGVHIGTIEVAMAKARSAILFRRPTKAFSDAMATGGPAYLALPGVVPFEGGVPLMMDDQLVGSIGVSGGTPDADGKVAAAAAAAALAAKA
ncbi:MAG TPA: heme-binding protein [Bauldia sp.]|nr:heme-binding protein [Bauldia sp.]